MNLLISIVLLLVQVLSCTAVGNGSATLNQLPNYAAQNDFDPYAFVQTDDGFVFPSVSETLAVNNQYGLLQDHFLLLKLQQLNRERIPARVVHGKGAGATGYFIVTNDISKYTRADFLQLGRKTKIAVRFSGANTEAGTPDTLLDATGFAIKFYTRDGIHDLLAFNTDVFLSRDPMKFADGVHARARNPQTHCLDANALFDFLVQGLESTYFTLQFFSDAMFPKSYRFIDGHAINIFKLVDAKGGYVYARFHWFSDIVDKPFFKTLEDAALISGQNPDYLIQELFDSIASGEWPSWTFKIQVMTEKEAKKYKGDPFDITKAWLDVPMITVGNFVLDRNPDNYFAEVEQIAFCPGHMVPGIEPGPDRLLQARMFAYSDAHNYRLGVNNAQIPINRCPFEARVLNRDGFMNVGPNGGNSPNYYPNSFHGLTSNNQNYYKQAPFQICGTADRVKDFEEDFFSQSKLFIENLEANDPEQLQRLLARFAAFLSLATGRLQQEIIRNMGYGVSKSFGRQLEKALNAITNSTSTS
ncbi:catalase-like [Bradysia coprophila]|uniref:catalase-like n=1 Tax=Bradysia coprophila TaxID=38358 RepID=UPI00187DABBE|nr:catalase-like [Bradysia coprophila]